MTVLNHATFAQLINHTFKVKLAEPILGMEEIDIGLTELALELVEVKESCNAQCEGFSLIFNGPSEMLLPQKLYAVSHDTLGENQIFLVPIGEKAEGEGENRKIVGYRYQAVFNRLKEQ